MNMNVGRLPKHPDERVHRIKTPGILQLPVEGYQGPIPEWPLDGPTKAELKRWNWLWRKPQAVRWIDAGIEDTVARYVKNCILLESGAAMNVATAHLTSEVRQQEDRLGRSPLSLMRLRWEVSTTELAELRQLRPEQTQASRRLRAIDPSLSEG